MENYKRDLELWAAALQRYVTEAQEAADDYVAEARLQSAQMECAMSVVTFDTLKFVETLEKAGVSREQASAFASAVKDSHDAAELATKADLRELKTEIKTDIADLRKDMLLLEQRMTIKLGSMLVVGIGVIAAIIKFL